MIKIVHFILIASKNHNKIVTLRLHLLQEYFNRFSPIITFITRLIEIISLINKENSSMSSLEHLFGFRCGMTDVLPHQIITRDSHDMTFSEITQAMQNQ